MDAENVPPVQRRPYWSFVALFYSLAGWMLFEAWLFLMGAGFKLHVIAAIPGAALVARSALRPSIDRSQPPERGQRSAMEPRHAGISCALLWVAGALFGVMVLNASLTLLGLVAVSFIFAPWARLSFCRARPALSCVITMTGCVSIITIGHGLIDTMFLPLAAWAFWLCACCALLFRAEQVQRIRRETMPKTVQKDLDAIHSPG